MFQLILPNARSIRRCIVFCLSTFYLSLHLADCVAAFVMFATGTGLLMGLFLNNAGGAWDNAKKYIETGSPPIKRPLTTYNRINYIFIYLYILFYILYFNILPE